jgi:hypothetical protein
MNPRVIKETHYLHQMVFCSKMQISLYVFFLKRAWELRIVMLTPTYCIKWFFHVQSVTNPCFVNYSILLCSCSLQSRCRCYLAHSQYVRLMKATITAQCGWRRRVARRELRNLKMVRDPLFKHLLHFYPICPFWSYCLAAPMVEVSHINKFQLYE